MRSVGGCGDTLLPEEYVAQRVRLAKCAGCRQDDAYVQDGVVVQTNEFLHVPVFCRLCNKRIVFTCVTELESHKRVNHASD